MVILTIVTQNNGETLNFDYPIPKVNLIKLISCSLYNSWHTLKTEGSGELGDRERDQSVSIGKIPPGHYSLDRFADEIKDIFKSHKYNLATETNTPLRLFS